jgi:hypothetical protein
MASQEGSLTGTYSAIASPTTRPIPISRNFRHKITDVVSKTRMTSRTLRLAQQTQLMACSRLQPFACHRLMRSHRAVFCRTLRFSDGRGRCAKGPERRQRPIGTHGSRKLHPADAWLQLYTPPLLRLLAAISDIPGVFVVVFLFSSCATFEWWPRQGQQQQALIV